jgi:heptosyltransferase I
MQVALRANLAARVIPAKIKIGFDWHRAKEGHSLFVNRRIEKQPFAHVLEGFMGFAQAIGVPSSEPRWQLPITDLDRETAQQYLEGLSRVVVIAPAASGSERNWLPERYAEVARHAYSQGFSIVLTGGPTELERRLASDIMRHIDFPVLNLVAKTSLKQLLCVLEEALLVIAPDTGPAHMAVTVGTPVIGLYAHSNPARTGPYLYQDYIVEVYHQNLQKQFGQSAGQLPWGRRVKGNQLMAQISTEAVIAMFDRVVKEQKML